MTDNHTVNDEINSDEKPAVSTEVTETALEDGSGYDAAAKRLFSNKTVIAVLLGLIVPEISGAPDLTDIMYSPVTAENIDTESIILDNTESDPMKDSSIVFDVLVHTADYGTYGLNIVFDIEIQNEFNPGYPILNRCIYYGSRLIDVQLRGIHGKNKYGRLRKVYCLFIRPSMGKNIKGGVQTYNMTPKITYPEGFKPAGVKQGDEDLLEIILAQEGKCSDSDIGLLKFLNSLLSRKGDGLEEFVDTQTEEFAKLEEEAENMGKLEKALKEMYVAEGKAEGIIGLCQDLNYNNETIAEVLMKKLDISNSEAQKWIKWYYSENLKSTGASQ